MSSTGSSEPSSKDVAEMNEWIWSLSMEPTDQGRRGKLTAVFTEKYMDLDFCNLFDEQLILVGDQIKERAAQAAAEAAADDDTSNSEQGEESNKDTTNVMDQEKSPEMKQLWAIVDLMVQKKTLVKRAREAEQ